MALFFFQAEDGIRDLTVTGVQTCALPISQFDLAMKLYHLLGNMTFAVERMNGVRLALDDRAGRLPAGDSLATRLGASSSAVDELRRQNEATREGRMITGE